MKSPAEIIRQLLVDLELGIDDQEDDWSVFVGFLPDKPNNAICVYDTQGRLDGRLMGTGEQIEHPGIQIRVRGTDYRTTWDKIRDIVLTLDAQSRVTVAFESTDAYLVQNISRTGGVLSMGVEEIGSRRCYNFVMNAVTTLFVDLDSDESPFVGNDWAPYWVRNP